MWKFENMLPNELNMSKLILISSYKILFDTFKMMSLEILIYTIEYNFIIIWNNCIKNISIDLKYAFKQCHLNKKKNLFYSIQFYSTISFIKFKIKKND